MGRFGGGGGYGRRNNEEREERSERRGSSRSSGYGSSRGGRSYSGGGRKRGGGFVNLGSVTTKKGTSDRVVDDLRSDVIGLWWQVYLPEGTKSITLKPGDRVFIQLGQFHKNAPDFVVGSVSLPTEDEGNSRSRRDDRDED